MRLPDRHPSRWSPQRQTRSAPAHPRGRMGAALKAAVLVALLAAAVPGIGPSSVRAQGLPSLGDGGELSVTDERRLGEQIARAIYRDPDYLDDPALADYLQRLWQPLLQAARERGEIAPDMAERYAWQLMPLRDRSVNAFALPGGYLGVHLGLIATTARADELASVLAHELSHVSQRHISRLIARQSQQAPWVIGAMVLGALAASKARNVDIGSAAMAGGQAVAAQGQLNFSRDMEREADRIGLSLMAPAGFDGLGFVTMFDKLQQASRLNDDGAFPYLRSHPLTTERMADMRARLPLQPDAALPGAPGAPGTLAGNGAAAGIEPAWHAMMAARARVLAETGVDRWRAMAAAPRPAADAADAAAPESLAARYAAALAWLRLRDFAAAQAQATELWQLLQGPAGRPQSRAAAEQLLLETLAEAGGAVPGSAAATLPLATLRDRQLAGPWRAGVLTAARAAWAGVGVAAGAQPAAARSAAVQRLQTWVSLQPHDALAWQLLAGLHQAQGDVVRAARADAESRLAQLDTAGALDRLKAAQALARRGAAADHFELSILDARLREVEQRARDEAAADARKTP